MSKYLTSFIALPFMLSACTNNVNRFSVFYVHLHGDAAPEKQLSNLAATLFSHKSNE